MNGYRNSHNRPSNDQVTDAWQSEAADITIDAQLFRRFRDIYESLYKQPRAIRRRLQNKGRMTLARVAMLLTLGMGHSLSASAADIWVNTLAPDIDAEDGKCALIEAIENANADAKTHADCQRGRGTDTIHLWRKNTYTLTKIHNTRTTGSTSYGTISNGLPIITSNIIFNGKDATIQRKFPGDYLRLFEVADSGELVLNDVTLTGGGSLSGASGTGAIPSIYYFAAVGPGGAIFNAGSAMLTNTRLVENHASGAIHNTGVMTISKSSISDNYGVGYTGGISNYGQITISDTTIDGNGAYSMPDGIYNAEAGKMEIRNSTVSGSQDAISNQGELSIDHSTIADNFSSTSADALYSPGLYDVITNSGNLILSNNLITGNPSSIKNGTYFGPNDDPFVHNVIKNTGAISSRSNIFGHDGIAFTSSDLTIAPSFASGFTPDASDIVATLDGNQPTALEDVLATSEQSTVPNDYPNNLDDNGKFPLLADNGGPTKTFALVPDSIAIDAVGATTDCPATDQRGVSRPQGGGCDIGAVELETTPPVLP